MSVLKNEANLILGNGDLFLGDSVPSVSAYKALYSGGGLPSSADYEGGIKGTVDVDIMREAVILELGTPLAIVAQAVMREAITFKCNLVEMSLSAVAQLIGGGTYTAITAGATLATNEPHALTTTIATALNYGPVLYTTSTPAATANPVVTLSTGLVTGASTPATYAATGTGTLTGASSISASGTTLTVGGTEATSQVYTIEIADLYSVSYTAQSGDTNSNIATGLKDAINGTTNTGSVSNPFVTAAFTATSSTNTVVVTQVAYVEKWDFLLDEGNDTVILTGDGSAAAGNYYVTYYYNATNSETLQVGGLSNLNQTQLSFFHPYQDTESVRVLNCLVPLANPTGKLTMPFDETKFTETPIEFRGISNGNLPAGQRIFKLYRDLPLSGILT